MGVSKIVREIEGKVGNERGWERGIWVKGLWSVIGKGLVNWGVFGKWMGMGGIGMFDGIGVSWWLSDDWFVESLIL